MTTETGRPGKLCSFRQGTSSTGDLGSINQRLTNQMPSNKKSTNQRPTNQISVIREKMNRGEGGIRQKELINKRTMNFGSTKSKVNRSNVADGGTPLTAIEQYLVLGVLLNFYFAERL